MALRVRALAGMRRGGAHGTAPEQCGSTTDRIAMRAIIDPPTCIHAKFDFAQRGAIIDRARFFFASHVAGLAPRAASRRSFATIHTKWTVGADSGNDSREMDYLRTDVGRPR